MTIAESIILYRALQEVTSIKDDSLRWNIAKNRRLLKNEVDLYDEQRIAIIRELSPKNQNVALETAEVQAQFVERDRVFQKKEADLPGFLKFTQAQAKTMTENPNILEALIPAISDP